MLLKLISFHQDDSSSLRASADRTNKSWNLFSPKTRRSSMKVKKE